jgi:hypothetical protein
MEFDKQSVLDLVKQQGGDTRPQPSNCQTRSSTTITPACSKRFGLNPDDLISKVGGRSHLGR